MITPGAFLLRLAAAVLAGVLIGLERQWRSRGAGLRTNTLVATGAAMFVLIAQMSGDQAHLDPTRITSYVVSGIGFLGAGVIIPDGTSIRGINTAATIWCAAAVGALSASGDIWQAGAGTVAVLAINIVLRPVGRRIDRRPLDPDTELETTYQLRATRSKPPPDAALSATLGVKRGRWRDTAPGVGAARNGAGTSATTAPRITEGPRGYGEMRVGRSGDR